MNMSQSAMVGMQGGAVGAPMNNSTNQNHEMLNTYIYDHLCKLKKWDLARSFYQSCPIKIDKTKKEMNGDDGMDADGSDKPEDLPVPNIGHHYSENSFLFDWWSQFWDVYGTARGKGNNALSNSYYAHNMAQAKMRNLSQQNMMGMGAQMMNRPQQQFPGNMQANGMNMQKQAMANRNGMQQMMAQNKMQQNNMQDGERPQSPGSMNAPSPSKRPRLDDGQQFNGQPAQAGRGGPMPGAQVGNMPGVPNGMMIQNGAQMPADLNQINFAQNGGQKLEVPGMAPQGMEGSFDMMNQQRPMANGAANPSQGNHALQDYQMQLMLLEQQNKKRLLMARQEQDNINHVPGTSQPGQIQFAGQAPGMSPQNGRPGPSPNPNDQMKRMQRPKMGPGNMPGSPAMAGGDNRGSPMPGNFDQNIPPNMRQQVFAQQQAGMMGGQPPSSHPNFQAMQMGQMPPNGMNIDQMRMAAAQGRMPNGQPWPQGAQPMMQNPSQGAQMGTPQQRPNAMPPPPAPNAEQQRTQPSSPAQGANGPPTPSQQNKAAPKGKKGDAKKANATQKGNAAKKDAATPAAANDAATPTPATPITPMHANSFGNAQKAANAAGPSGGAQPPQQQAPPPQQQPAPVPIENALDFGADTGGFNLDFTADGPDVLENFDFDSFLHNTEDTNNFGFDFMNMGGMSQP